MSIYVAYDQVKQYTIRQADRNKGPTFSWSSVQVSSVVDLQSPNIVERVHMQALSMQ